MPEKLLTLKEASYLLGLSEQEVKDLIEKGELPAYQIGGQFLRFRREQLETIKNELWIKLGKAMPKENSHNLQKAMYSESFADKFVDFFYFNDFYILSAIVILVAVVLMVTT